MRLHTCFPSSGNSGGERAGREVGSGDRCTRLRMGKGLLEEVSFMRCLEGWAECSSVEKAELVAEGVPGGSSTDEGVEGGGTAGTCGPG